jgi:hypothetical protein
MVFPISATDRRGAALLGEMAQDQRLTELLARSIDR